MQPDPLREADAFALLRAMLERSGADAGLRIEEWTPWRCADDAWGFLPVADALTSTAYLVRNGQVRRIHLAFDSIPETLATMRHELL